MKTIIFTDLDGTFLNHDDYSFQAANEALEILRQKQIPIIFTTSKTKPEVEVLQKKVGIKEPFIIENGGALFIPKNYQNLELDFLQEYKSYKILKFGKTYPQILKFYNKYKDEFRLEGFSDMSITRIMELTNLDRASALFAKERDFSEPFIIKDESRLLNLCNLASTANMKIIKGGRFYHLISNKQDKSYAVKGSIEIFQTLYEKEIRSIALGDGPNDRDMLKSVNIPIVIKNHKNEYLDIDLPNLQKSSFQGSMGWNEMVLKNV